MTNITTDYAALTYGSTPYNSLYVRRNGAIIGAIMRVRDNSGEWRAFMADDLLDLRKPTAHPSREAAIAAIIANA
jgi:hypothetical protein